MGLGIADFVLVAALVSQAESPTNVAIMPLVANRIAADTVKILDELLINSVDRRAAYDAIGPADIAAMLGFERMKDAVACDEVTCATEIGGALGVELMIAGSVSRLGSSVIVSLRMVDVRRSEVTARAEARVEDNEDLYLSAINAAVGQLLGDTLQPTGQALPKRLDDAGDASDERSSNTDVTTTAAAASVPADQFAADVGVDLIGLSFAAGPAFNLANKIGSTFYAEAGYRLGPLELAFGVTYPVILVPTVRGVLEWELGRLRLAASLAFAVPLIMQGRPNVGAGVAGGLGAGVGVATPAGVFGFRVEIFVSYDVDAKAVAVPLGILGRWQI